MFSKRFSGVMPLGLFLFVAAFPLLFWNEGRAVKTARALTEGARQVVTVEASLPDGQNDQALVHVSGQATAAEMLQDPLLQLETQAFKLQRKVEMYQWAQLTSQEDDTESWYYDAQWSEKLIDSSDFPLRYQNPKTLPYRSETFVAEEVKIGDFQVSSSLISKLNSFQPLSPQLSPQTLADIFGQDDIRVQGNSLYIPYGDGSEASPAVGDLRINLEHIPLGVISIVAQQNGRVLEPYQARSGHTVAMIRPGVISAQEMFESAVKENNALTLFLRVLGFGVMAGGIRLLFRPLTVISRFVPLVGGMIRFGATAVAGVLAFVLSLITASVAWFSYRPQVAVPLLLIAVAGFYLAQRTGNKLAKTPQRA